MTEKKKINLNLGTLANDGIYNRSRIHRIESAVHLALFINQTECKKTNCY